jgi:hypothetical protein
MRVASSVHIMMLAATVCSTAARAQPPRAGVILEGDLPFGRDDLIEAIELRRLLARGDPRRGMPVVIVRASSNRRAVIAVGRAVREISLGDQSGVPAARTVALHVIDLLSAAASASPDAPPEEPLLARRDVAPPADRFVLAVSPQLCVGPRDWAPAFEPTLDFSVRMSRRLRVYLDIGFTWSTAAEAAGSASLWEIPIHAGLGFRCSWVELRAGSAVRPYVLSGLGDEEGVLLGGSISVLFVSRLRSWLLGFVSVGIDGYYRRTRFQMEGRPVLTTNWAVPWLGVGAGWQGGR